MADSQKCLLIFGLQSICWWLVMTAFWAFDVPTMLPLWSGFLIPVAVSPAFVVVWFGVKRIQ